MSDDFKTKLKENGQSIKWFYDRFIKGNTDLTYSGFTAQLNGYAPISEQVKNKINQYILESKP